MPSLLYRKEAPAADRSRGVDAVNAQRTRRDLGVGAPYLTDTAYGNDPTTRLARNATGSLEAQPFEPQAFFGMMNQLNISGDLQQQRTSPRRFVATPEAEALQILDRYPYRGSLTSRGSARVGGGTVGSRPSSLTAMINRAVESGKARRRAKGQLQQDAATEFEHRTPTEHWLPAQRPQVRQAELPLATVGLTRRSHSAEHGKAKQKQRGLTLLIPRLGGHNSVVALAPVPQPVPAPEPEPEPEPELELHPPPGQVHVQVLDADLDAHARQKPSSEQEIEHDGPPKLDSLHRRHQLELNTTSPKAQTANDYQPPKSTAVQEADLAIETAQPGEMQDVQQTMLPSDAAHSRVAMQSHGEGQFQGADTQIKPKTKCHPANLRCWRWMLLQFLLLEWFLLPARIGWLWSQPYWETTGLFLLVSFGDACFALDIHARHRNRHRQSQMEGQQTREKLEKCSQNVASCIDLAACTMLYLSALVPSPADDWAYFASLVPRLVRCRVLLDELHRRASQMGRRTAVGLRLLFVITSSTQWAGAVWFLSARAADFAANTWLHQLANDAIVVDPSLVDELIPGVAATFNRTAADVNQELLMAALFFGVSSLTTVGYSGISPGSPAEALICISMVFVKFLLHTLILGIVYHNFVHSSRARKPHVSTMSAVAVYAVEAPSEEEEESEDEDSAPYHAAVGTMLSHIKGRINPRLFRKVSKYVTVERAVELHTERKILALLPADLKIQLAEERYSALIEGSRLFESCSVRFVQLLMQDMHAVRMTPGETVFASGEVARHLTFVLSGSVDILSERGSVLREVHAFKEDRQLHKTWTRIQKLQSLFQGVLGEVAFVMDTPHTHTAKVSGTDTLEVVQLTKTDYRRWREMYPSERTTVEDNVLAYLNIDRSGVERTWLPSRHALLEEEFKAVQYAVKHELAAHRSRAAQDFRQAAADGDIDAAQAFLDQGIEVDESDYDHRTSLHYAALAGQSAMVDFLVEAGADLNARNIYGCTPVEDAALRKHGTVVHALLMHGAVLPAKASTISSEMLLAILDGDHDAVQDFLELIDVNSIDHNGQTLLHHAAAAGRVQSISQLIEMKCDVNIRDHQGWTALLVASTRLNEAAALMIRGAGGICDVDCGGICTTEAAKKGQSEVLRLLIDCGIPIDWQDYVGKTATHFAASSGHVQTLQYLINASADLAVRCRHGRTALDDAASCGRLIAGKMLYIAGASSSSYGKRVQEVQHVSASQVRSYVKFASQQKMLDCNYTRSAIDQLCKQARGMSEMLNLVARVLEHVNVDDTGQLKHVDADAVNELIDNSNCHLPFLSPIESLLCRGCAVYRGLGAVQNAVKRHLLSLTRSNIQAVLHELGFEEALPSELLISVLNEIKLELASATGAAQDSVVGFSRAIMLSKTFATIVRTRVSRSEAPESGLKLVHEAFLFMEQVFALLDRNNDNIIDRADVEHCMNENGSACPEIKELWKRFTEEPKARISKHMLKHVLLPSGLVDRPRAGSDDPETEQYMNELLHHIANDAVDTALDAALCRRSQAMQVALAARGGELQRISTPGEDTGDDNVAKTSRSGMWASVRKNVSSHVAKLGNQVDFSAGWQKMKIIVNPDPEHSLRQLFDMIDTDGSGGLSRAEVQNLLETFYCGAVPDSELNRFIDILDQDGDGDITWEEFALSWGKLKGRIRSLVPDEVLSRDMTVQHWYLILPSSKRLRWWKRLTQLGCIYYFFAIQARIAFLRHDTTSIWSSFAIDYCIDMLFLFDMVVNSLICYVNKRGLIVVDPVKTFRRYLHGGFFRDLVASAPLDVFARAAGANITFVNWSRSLKLLRVGRLSSLVRRRRRDAQQLRSALLRLCYMFIGLLHTTGCMWFVVVEQTATGNSGRKWEAEEAIARWYDEDVAQNASSSFQYIMSVYWTSAALSGTAAPTEFQPTNLAEVLATVTLLTLHLTFVVFMLMEFFDAVVRHLAAADAEGFNVVPIRPEISHQTSQGQDNTPSPPPLELEKDSTEAEDTTQSEKVPDQLTTADAYFSHNSDLSTEWRAEVFDHCSLVAQHGSMKCSSLNLSLFDFISPQLQLEVALQLCGDVVSNSDTFKRCSVQLKQVISWSICQHQQILGPGSTLFSCEDVALQMWFVINGEVVLHEADDSEACVVSPVSLGGLPFLRGVSFGQTARTGLNSPVTCCILRRSDFTDIIQDFPDDEQALRDFVAHSVGSDVVHQRQDEEAYAKIMRAVCEQNETSLRVVLDDRERHHGGLEWRDFDGRTALHHACALGASDIVECLCEHGAQTYAMDRFGDEPLDLALRKGADDIVAFLRQRGGTVNAAPSMTYPIGVLCGLVVAADAEGIVRLLDAQGCSVNETDYRQRSALHVAATQGSIAIVELLLARGADPTLTDVRGSTPLQNAVEARHVAVAQVLVQHGAAVAVESWPAVGETLGRCTADGDSTSMELLELVLTASDNGGVVASSTDSFGRTALHVAALVGNVAAANLVVKQMASVGATEGINCRDLCGYTPADMAQHAGNKEILDILKQHGAIFGSQLGVPRIPYTTTHDLNTAGVDGIHPGDPGDLSVARRLEKSLISAPSAAFIEQLSDAVLLCSAITEGSSTLQVECASAGFLRLVQLDREQVLGPIDNVFELTGLSHNGQQNDQALSISRTSNAVGPSAVQLLISRPKAAVNADSVADERVSGTASRSDSRWVLWQVWPVSRRLPQERNSNDPLRQQIHVLWDISRDVMLPQPTASVDQMVRCTTAAIDGPLEDLCTACLQLGKLAALSAAPHRTGAHGSTPVDAPADWFNLLRDNRRGVQARVEELLERMPPILRLLVSEARSVWTEPLQHLLHTQAASTAPFDLTRALPATAWQIDRALRRIEHTLDQLVRAGARDAAKPI